MPIWRMPEIQPMAKQTKAYSREDLQLAKYSKALGHPARVAIMRLLLSKSDCMCGDIVKELPLAQSTVSQHLKELKEAGLIQGNITPPRVKYCVNRENWEIAKQVIETFLE